MVSITPEVQADFLELPNGQVIFGKILSRDRDGVRFERKTATYTYPAKMIVHEFARVEAAKPADSTGLPSFGHVLDNLGKYEWAYDMKHIPATVVDKGVLRNVPYLSFRCGVDYEANIYGDPEYPAGIEIGFYRSLLKKPEARENCLAFFAALFTDTSLSNAIVKLNRDTDLQTVGQWKIEVTPPEGNDSYGGWWVSIYSEQLLDSSRATPAELSRITVAKSQIAKSPTDLTAWSSEDLRYARPATYVATTPTYTPGSTSYSGGSVYVRGYTRKDGTYVRPHTRKR